jgi:hypothetical protein
VGIEVIPAIANGIRARYADKFGNVRLLTDDIGAFMEMPIGQEVRLVVGGEELNEKVLVAGDINDMDEDQLGVYVNVADGPRDAGPGYIELCRRDSDCNRPDVPSAFRTLASHVTKLSVDGTFRPRDLDAAAIGIAA